jgi:transmembrane sensor
LSERLATGDADNAVDVAIDWYVRQASGLMDADESARLTRWLAEDPGHQQIWQRLQRMGEQLQGSAALLPPPFARTVLKRLPDLERRKAVRLLSWLAAGGSLYLGRDMLREAALPADFQTAVGARSEVRLADGTLLQLNTDSAVDVHFDRQRRLLRLRRGEILIVTASDPTGRPFQVDTRDGRLTPVGTRFSVRQEATATLLGVSAGAVDVELADGGERQRIHAGEQLWFGSGGGTPQALDETLQSWSEGMLSASNRRLDDLLGELARYRRGHLGCTPAAGALRITGTWPLRGDAPSDEVLASLARHLPIRIDYLTRYWVTVDHQ